MVLHKHSEQSTPDVSDDGVRSALRQLPDVPPPEHVWQRIIANLPIDKSSRRSGGESSQMTGYRDLFYWINPTRAAALSICLIGLVSVLVWRTEFHLAPESSADATQRPSLYRTSAQAQQSELEQLFRRSQILEKAIRESRVDGYVWNTTGRALEYRISNVDQKLNRIGVERKQYSPEYRRLLQRRLALMDSLLQVEQSAQSVIF